jgi:hypothetical protein
LTACDCADGCATHNTTARAANQNAAARNMKEPPCCLNSTKNYASIVEG